VRGTHARWIGHRLHGEADIAVDAALSVGQGLEIAQRFRLEVMRQVPALAVLRVGIEDNRRERRDRG